MSHPEATLLDHPAQSPARQHPARHALTPPLALRSKVTARSQTTLPSGVRRALGLRPGEDQIEYVVQGDQAVIRRASPAEEDEDPVILAFLDFLERHLRAHPEHAVRMPESLYRAMLTATEGVPAPAPDEPIEGEVAL